VNTFGDCLEDFDVQRSSTTVVPIIFVFLVTDDAICSLGSCKPHGGGLRYPRDDLTGIKRENGGVRIDGVWIQDLWNVDWLEDGFWKVRSEWVFIGTAGNANRVVSERLDVIQTPRVLLPRISPCFSLKNPFITYKRCQQVKTRAGNHRRLK
jgi:hypothetical protein